jgi:hypothetical protein
MTETEWLVNDKPRVMIEFLRGRISDRKLGLLAVASARSTDHKSRGVRARWEIAERYFEGRATTTDVRRFWGRESYSWPTWPEHPLEWALALTNNAPARHPVPWHEKMVRLLRDIIGPLPFRTVLVAPTWLAWNDGAILKMAQLIYDDRAFDRLPLLADALEDAGCTDADILAHCRSGGEHVRGCWVVDLLLGKE